MTAVLLMLASIKCNLLHMIRKQAHADSCSRAAAAAAAAVAAAAARRRWLSQQLIRASQQRRQLVVRRVAAAAPAQPPRSIHQEDVAARGSTEEEGISYLAGLSMESCRPTTTTGPPHALLAGRLNTTHPPAHPRTHPVSRLVRFSAPRSRSFAPKWYRCVQGSAYWALPLLAPLRRMAWRKGHMRMTCEA